MAISESRAKELDSRWGPEDEVVPGLKKKHAREFCVLVERTYMEWAIETRLRNIAKSKAARRRGR